MNFINEILDFYDLGDRNAIENKLYEVEDFKSSLLIEVEMLRRVVRLNNDKLEVTPAAFISPMAYGSKVTLFKPIEPIGEDERVDWYCEPLFKRLLI